MVERETRREGSKRERGSGEAEVCSRHSRSGGQSRTVGRLGRKLQKQFQRQKTWKNAVFCPKSETYAWKEKGE